MGNTRAQPATVDFAFANFLRNISARFVIHSKMVTKTPLLVAHRGYPARFPENSLEGITAALQAGAAYVELDVQSLADGTLVLFHDPTLLRTTGSTGEIFELTRLRIGAIAPDIEGEDFDGVAFKLSDYRGKVVFLDFWGHW